MKESLKDLVDRLVIDKDAEMPPPAFVFRGVPAPGYHEVGQDPPAEMNEKKSRNLSETRVGISPEVPTKKTLFRGSAFVGDFLDNYLSREQEKEAAKNANSLFFVNISLGSSTQAGEIYADLKKSGNDYVKAYGYFRSSIDLGAVGRTQEEAIQRVSDALGSCGYMRSSYYFHKVKQIS